MSKFRTLNKDVLLQVAEEFGVDTDEKETKETLIAKFAEDGVTWEMYKSAFPDIEDLPDEPQENVSTTGPVVLEEEKPQPPVRDVPQVLVKMERLNPHYEYRGHVFSKAHPFVPLSEDDANYLISHFDGFRIAMPSEAEAFYK